jgi:hypothetical protein
MRTLNKSEKQHIKNNYNWSLSYLIIDIISKFGDNAYTLDEEIEMAITWYHNVLRANWGVK